MYKILFPTVLLLFSIISGCDAPSNKPQKILSPEEQRLSDAEQIFKSTCTLCHGIDGTLGLNGAKNLATSTLSREEKINIITHGKNSMAAYGNELSSEEIENIADYIETLKKK